MTNVSWEWNSDGEDGSAYVTDGLSGLDWEVHHGEEDSEIEIFARKILEMADARDQAIASEREAIRMALSARGDAFIAQAERAEAGGHKNQGACRRAAASALYAAAETLCRAACAKKAEKIRRAKKARTGQGQGFR